MNDRERRAWAIEQACLMLHSATPSDVCHYAEKLLNWVMADTPAPTADKDGWIEHDGKGCPVSSETLVSIVCSDGYEQTNAPAKLWGSSTGHDCDWWDWKTCPNADRIVKYRVITE